ncbi:MAG TPA: hypothetical protein VFW65_31195 [Pseudonocardiaceae bacterium]|nr:hypothetical protein [Pseudonocardiaceae bacterium]
MVADPECVRNTEAARTIVTAQSVVQEPARHRSGYLDFNLEIQPLTWCFVSWTGVFDY